MASWCNKVKQSVHPIVSKSGVTLDARFFGKNVVVLALQMTDDFGEAGVGKLA